MSRRTPKLHLIVRVEPDPSMFPIEGSQFTIHAHVDGRTPILGVHNLGVDPLTLIRPDPLVWRAALREARGMSGVQPDGSVVVVNRAP